MNDDYVNLLKFAEKNSNDAARNMSNARRIKSDASRGPAPSAIAAFKARQERERQAEQARINRERSQLLALRAQNSKSLKKSKIMASRTKDNNFGNINVTENDLNEHSKIDEKIRSKGLIFVLLNYIQTHKIFQV